MQQANAWKATTLVWVSVLILTAATAMFFRRAVRDSPLGTTGLVFVAFFWFLAAFGVRWPGKDFGDGRLTDESTPLPSCGSRRRSGHGLELQPKEGCVSASAPIPHARLRSRNGAHRSGHRGTLFTDGRI